MGYQSVMCNLKVLYPPHLDMEHDIRFELKIDSLIIVHVVREELEGGSWIPYMFIKE